MNSLNYGDNLVILREYIADEFVHLIYLYPLFNLKRDYNVLLRTLKDHALEAEVATFEDIWRWGKQAERENLELHRIPKPIVTFKNFK